MKENYVILKETYNNNSYEIIINTHLGTFRGYTEVDEIDINYPSRYHAGEIAYAKALRKFAEAAVSALKREINILESLMKQSIDAAENTCDIDNTSFRLINGMLKQKQKELKKWEARIEGLSKSIQDRIAARDKLVANYIKKDKNK